MADEIEKKTIGRAEQVSFPELGLGNVPARIDTGAKRSTIWVKYAEPKDDQLEVIFFDEGKEYYTGQKFRFETFEPIIVASSTGQTQQRYMVRLLVKIRGKKVRAWFTLADRSTQVYPVLIGRNVLSGKFVVDVKKGKVLREAERERTNQLQGRLRNEPKEDI